jgi:hypothetical protein
MLRVLRMFGNLFFNSEDAGWEALQSDGNGTWKKWI